MKLGRRNGRLQDSCLFNIKQMSFFHFKVSFMSHFAAIGPFGLKLSSELLE